MVVQRTHTYRNLAFGQRRRKAESAMGSASVVVRGVRRERPIEMPSTLTDEDLEILGASVVAGANQETGECSSDQAQEDSIGAL
jgi:DNA-binding protein YbaB